jgi:hypothetical protein
MAFLFSNIFSSHKTISTLFVTNENSSTALLEGSQNVLGGTWSHNELRMERKA